MRTIRFAPGSLLLLAFFAPPSMAQVQRTFVSGLGDDGNPCSRTAPCRTLTQAIYADQRRRRGDRARFGRLRASYGRKECTQAYRCSRAMG
jgi:hypothetical protein